MSRRDDLSAVPAGANAIRVNFDEDEPPALVFNDSALPGALVSWAWNQLSALDTLLQALSQERCGDASGDEVAGAVCCFLAPAIKALKLSEERAFALESKSSSSSPPKVRRDKGRKAPPVDDGDPPDEA